MKEELERYIEEYGRIPLWIEPYHIGEFLKTVDFEGCDWEVLELD